MSEVTRAARQVILADIFDLSKWGRPDNGRETYLQTPIELADLTLFAHAIAVVDQDGEQVADDPSDQAQLEAIFVASCSDDPLKTIPWNGRDYVIAVTS